MPRFDKDYYRILGVPEDATPEALKRAYRAKAKELHPDRAGGDKQKEAAFKEVNEAHEVLSDPQKRAHYDRMRKGGFPEAGAEGFSGGFPEDMGDLFGSFFDVGAWGRHAGSRDRKDRGEDTAFQVLVPFATAALGGKTTIQLPKREACGSCSGTGAKDGKPGKPCKSCRGSGMDSRPRGGFAFSRPCPACSGRGTDPAPACRECGGEGIRALTRTIEVKVPAGVSDGSRIRLAGEGAPGLNGGPPGDCLLEIRVEPHPHFERDGADILGSVEVDFSDAILGVEVPAQTLQGPVTLRIPPGTQPGARLRLAGMGVQPARGEPGDHYVRVKVRLPRTLTEAQKKALEAFRAG